MIADALRAARLSTECVMALLLGGVAAYFALALLVAPVGVVVVAGVGLALCLGSRRIMVGLAYASGVAFYAAILLWQLTTVTTPYW